MVGEIAAGGAGGHDDLVRLGARLRQARQGAGLSCEDLAKRLNLRVATIEAIEEGTGEAMIGEMYAKSHTKTIAALLGVSLTEEDES
jgi:cytoskeleton protein RodZ